MPEVVKDYISKLRHKSEDARQIKVRNIIRWGELPFYFAPRDLYVLGAVQPWDMRQNLGCVNPASWLLLAMEFGEIHAIYSPHPFFVVSFASARAGSEAE